MSDFPKMIKMYLHGDKDTNWNTGKEIGLSEKAISENFKYALYEVELDVLVSEDGKIEIIAVDGYSLKTTKGSGGQNG